MRLLFWLCFSWVALGYAGYPMYVYIRARFWPRPARRGAERSPYVSLILTARNEGSRLPSKLLNIDELNYPKELLEVIAVSDGSIDATNEILSEWRSSRRHAVILSEHVGKAAALNAGIALAQGEVICFADAAQTIVPDGLKNLVDQFADPTVGCVSGQLGTPASPKESVSEGVGLYWRLEKNIREWESISGSTVGATGAFYAVRRNLLSQIPEGTILDDVYIPLLVARRGLRTVFESGAEVVETRTFSPREEFWRKVRTLTGNYQLLKLAPWVLTRPNPLRFRFVCHKLVRLMIPFALVGLFVSTLFLRENLYQLALVAQLAFYGLAVLAMLQARVIFVSRLANIAFTFLMLNTAAALAFLYFISGKRPAWAR